jgi:hypothetical protein
MDKPKVTIVVETDPDDESGFACVTVLVNGKRIASGRAGGGEPEDNTYHRDYSWIDDGFASLARALGAEVSIEHSKEER